MRQTAGWPLSPSLTEEERSAAVAQQLSGWAIPPEDCGKRKLPPTLETLPGGGGKTRRGRGRKREEEGGEGSCWNLEGAALERGLPLFPPPPLSLQRKIRREEFPFLSPLFHFLVCFPASGGEDRSV